MDKSTLISVSLIIAELLAKQTSNSLDDKAIQLIKEALGDSYREVDLKDIFISGLKELAKYTDNEIDDYLVEKIEGLLR